MAGKQQFTVAQILEAIPGTGGLPVAIGAKLHCSGQTVRNYAERYPSIATALKAEKADTTDFVENALMRAIKDGNVTAMIFYLKTQAKDRGYVERQEVTGATGGPLVVRWVDPHEPG